MWRNRSTRAGEASLASVLLLLKHTPSTLTSLYTEGVSVCHGHVATGCAHHTRQHRNVLSLQVLVACRCRKCHTPNDNTQVLPGHKAQQQGCASSLYVQAASTGDSRVYKVPGVDVKMPFASYSTRQRQPPKAAHTHNNSRTCHMQLQACATLGCGATSQHASWRPIKAAAFADSAEQSSQPLIVD